MKIIMKTIAAGPHYTYHPGQVVDVTRKIANEFITRGFAVEAKIEAATVKPPENAMQNNEPQVNTDGGKVGEG